MKYQVENRKLNSIDDLIEFKKYIDSQYNKEKNDLESDDKIVKESLYGEYLDVFVRTITNMMKEAISSGNDAKSNLMIDLSRLLGVTLNKHLGDNKEVFYTADELIKAVNSNKVYDKTYNAIIEGKLDNILASFEQIEDIDDIISEAVEMTEEYEARNGFTEKLKDKEEKAVNAKRENRNASYEKKATKLSTKVEANWNNEGVNAETNAQKLYRLDENRKRNLAKANKMAKMPGRNVNITDSAKYSQTISENDIDFNVIETKEDLERIFSDTEIFAGSFKIVREFLSEKRAYLNDLNDTLEDGIIKTSDVLKVGTLDLYSQMVKIRENRGFFDKLFHPFQNSKEKKLINELHQDLIAKGVSEEEIEASTSADFDISKAIDDLALKNGLKNLKDTRTNIEVKEINNNNSNLQAQVTNSKNLDLEKSTDSSLTK